MSRLYVSDKRMFLAVWVYLYPHGVWVGIFGLEFKRNLNNTPREMSRESSGKFTIIEYKFPFAKPPPFIALKARSVY
jgi:hypothetical protein